MEQLLARWPTKRAIQDTTLEGADHQHTKGRQVGRARIRPARPGLARARSSAWARGGGGFALRSEPRPPLRPLAGGLPSTRPAAPSMLSAAAFGDGVRARLRSGVVAHRRWYPSQPHRPSTPHPQPPPQPSNLQLQPSNRGPAPTAPPSGHAY